MAQLIADKNPLQRAKPRPRAAQADQNPPARGNPEDHNSQKSSFDNIANYVSLTKPLFTHKKSHLCRLSK